MSSLHSSDPIERKIQRAGGSTFTVSLPKEWARGQNITAGETVYLYPLDDRVIVAPSERPSNSETTRICIQSGDSVPLGERIRQAYATGSERIVVDGDGPLSDTHRRDAVDSFQTLVGMSVEEKSSTRVVGKSMLDATAISVDQALTQAHHFTVRMLEDALEALLEGTHSRAIAARERHEEIERLAALVERQFHGALIDVRQVQENSLDRQTAYHVVRIVAALERVAESADNIASIAIDQATEPPQAVRTAFEDVGGTVVTALRHSLRTDESHQDDCVAEVSRLQSRLESCENSDSFRDGIVTEALRRTADEVIHIATHGAEDMSSAQRRP